MSHKTPVAASQFLISIDGVQVGSFSELQGITTEVGPISSRRKVLPHELTHVVQGKAGTGPITLEVKSADLGSIAALRLRRAAGRTLTLSATNSRGGRATSYRGKLMVPEGSAKSETVTIVCEQLQRVAL